MKQLSGSSTGEKKNPLKGMEWGLCHDVSQDYGFIKRFDIDEWQKKVYTNREMYE